jgi:hypothetical protein
MPIRHGEATAMRSEAQPSGARMAPNPLPLSPAARLARRCRPDPPTHTRTLSEARA